MTATFTMKAPVAQTLQLRRSWAGSSFASISRVASAFYSPSPAFTAEDQKLDPGYKIEVCAGPVAGMQFLGANANPAVWATDGPVFRVPWPFLKEAGQLHWVMAGDYVNLGVNDFINFDLDVDLAQPSNSDTSVGLFTLNGARAGGAVSTGGTGWFKVEATLTVNGDETGAPKHTLDARVMVYTAANVLINEAVTRARYSITANAEKKLRWIYRVQGTAANGTTMRVRSWNGWYDCRRR